MRIEITISVENNLITIPAFIDECGNAHVLQEDTIEVFPLGSYTVGKPLSDVESHDYNFLNIRR